ncbi:MAG: hypothetical protein DI537_17490 [Stutzerimonas stutzeri]|nr:MAG: hypothetical protein DI537_17490 [Stutzerimonas stutzeri]
MPRLLKPAPPGDLERVDRSIEFIRKAIQELPAECPKTKDKLRSALKSAEGARRHMMRRVPSVTAIPREG